MIGSIFPIRHIVGQPILAATGFQLVSEVFGIYVYICRN
jgi:hypothetical protein